FKREVKDAKARERKRREIKKMSRRDGEVKDGIGGEEEQLECARLLICGFDAAVK
ncbi:hypothetical protein PIB30_099242, partial [Stylosanthes scabra]|nr:hypothetical protein [Stylosanthes scabra]